MGFACLNKLPTQMAINIFCTIVIFIVLLSFCKTMYFV